MIHKTERVKESDIAGPSRRVEMRMMKLEISFLKLSTAVCGVALCLGHTQTVPAYQAEAEARTQFVSVQPDVKLEVLDWGGTGRSLVFLAGGEIPPMFSTISLQSLPISIT
jgi:hypothetical protein